MVRVSDPPNRRFGGDRPRRIVVGRRLGYMRRGAAGENQGDLTANETCRHLRQPVILTVGPAIIDLDVLALDIVGFAQRLAERGNLDAESFADRLVSNPITCIRGFCARATRGQAAVPPSRAISCRRFISTPSAAEECRYATSSQRTPHRFAASRRAGMSDGNSGSLQTKKYLSSISS